MVRADGVCVIDKPWGLPSTGRDLDDPDCAQAWVRRVLGKRRVWAVHQLDKDTSGLNVFVWKKSLVEPWTQRLKQGQKHYLAVVRGRFPSRARTCEAPIGFRNEGHKRFPALRSDGKPAKTWLAALSVNDKASLVEARPTTGRTHQVRLHLAHVGHPLLGEPLHVQPPCTRHHRHALHAWKLDLPDLGVIEAPPAPDLVDLVKKQGLVLKAPGQ